VFAKLEYELHNILV